MMLVTVWSIQTATAWQCLQEHGVLRARSAYIEPTWFPAYQWMARQLAQRVGPAPAGCDLPVWVWLRWNGERQPKPDLRYKAHLPSGTQGVRLSLQVDPKRLLCSDFDLWHYPLTNSYLPKTQAELAQIEMHETSDRSPSDLFKQHELEQSWNQIFDLNGEYLDFMYAQSEKSIQAVLWEIKQDDVIAVKQFYAR